MGRNPDAPDGRLDRTVLLSPTDKDGLLPAFYVIAAGRGRIVTLPPMVNEPERGVHAASSFASQQVNRLVYSLRKLKRPEGRAPGAVSGCARRTRRIKNIFARMVLCLVT